MSNAKLESKSQCCNSPIHASGSGEGTWFYICDKCKKPCDAIDNSAAAMIRTIKKLEDQAKEVLDSVREKPNSPKWVEKLDQFDLYVKMDTDDPNITHGYLPVTDTPQLKQFINELLEEVIKEVYEIGCYDGAVAQVGNTEDMNDDLAKLESKYLLS